ncbi:MAG: endonuclease/exonuclease/phosphatase family protein [Sphaerochaetaceae bacterium]|nr:endonuclease/exonuclease/phosphatase family protein [Sphaerochaetaceae bacterium]
MNRSFLNGLFVFILVVLLLASCDGQGVEENATSLCITTWNVQNLFDAVLDGNEYEEYKPSETWNEAMYQKRLVNARKVISCLPKAKDYVIVLNEIEGSKVIEDLLFDSNMSRMGLNYYACTPTNTHSIQNAVISSIPVAGTRYHSVSENLRPILEVEFVLGKERFFVLAVHLKSNIGDANETASLRYESAVVIAQIAKKIQMENPGCPVFICGDFNEECWESNIMSYSKDKTSPLPVSSSFEPSSWYCFWLEDDSNIWPKGSYCYKDMWKCYDNILVSYAGKDGTGYEFEKAGIVFENFQKTADLKPFAWDKRLLTGVSDHLPVWILLN